MLDWTLDPGSEWVLGEKHSVRSSHPQPSSCWGNLENCSAGEGGSWVGEVCVVTMSRLSLGLVLNRPSFFFLSAKESWEEGRKVPFFCPSLP